ncbi:hypothetical protein, partial [Enterobacter hormaechei]
RKGGGVEADAVEGVASERKCAVGGVHGFPFSIVRPDALTPALSHTEREQKQKKATGLPFCFYHAHTPALYPTERGK